MTAVTPTEKAVSFENIHIAFERDEVLSGLTFSVAQQETKVLIGESGAGKTVALKLAAGLLRADSGSVRVLGQDVAAMSENQLLDFRRKIGFVFQESALFDSLTVEENVAYRLREEGKSGDEIEQRVRESLRFVEMEDAIDKMPAELSGGMRRRVSIARALIDRPPLVLYDSPTAGLDPVTSQTIITLIMRLRDTQGVTSILATHRLQDAFGLANYRFDTGSGRVVALSQNGKRPAIGATNFLVLRHGINYFEGAPEKLLESRDEYLRRFLF